MVDVRWGSSSKRGRILTHPRRLSGREFVNGGIFLKWRQSVGPWNRGFGESRVIGGVRNTDMARSLLQAKSVRGEPGWDV